MQREQQTGCAAALSILAAVGCYVSICVGHPVLALVLALVSVPLGAIGLLMAASPRVGGGMLSIVAILLGAIGVVLSLLAVVFGLFV